MGTSKRGGPLLINKCNIRKAAGCRSHQVLNKQQGSPARVVNNMAEPELLPWKMVNAIATTPRQVFVYHLCMCMPGHGHICGWVVGPRVGAALLQAASSKLQAAVRCCADLIAYE